MFDLSFIRIIKVGFKSLLLHKLRSGLTMLGMIIGVGAVIALVAIGEGASHDAQEAIRALGAQNVIIRSIKPPSMRMQMQGDWESFFRRWLAYYGLKNSDAARIRDTVPHVKRVLPILNQRKNIIHGTRDMTVPFHQSVIFHAALKKAGVESTLITVNDGGHGAPRPATDQRVQLFLERHFFGKGKQLPDETVPAR